MAEPIPLIGATFLLAGFVKGMLGLGLPTVAMGLLGLAMPPAQAAALLVIPSLATNFWQMAAGPRLAALLLRFWPMMLGICAGTWLGPTLPVDGAAGTATAALGVALMSYAALGLARPRLSLRGRLAPGLGLLIGAATGLVTAATGVFVVPAVPYMQALGLEPPALVQALGLSFTVSTLALAASLAHSGAFQPATAGASLLALAPALAGMLLGQRLRRRLGGDAFRFWFFLGLLALGGDMVLRSFF